MGAGLSLILAGSLALSFVSALIAFNGWPGTQSQRTADERAVIAQLAPARAAQGLPAALRLPDVPRHGAVAPSRRTAARITGSRPVSSPGSLGLARVATKTKAAKKVAHAPAPAASVPVKAATVSAAAKPDVLHATLAPAASTVKNLGSTLDSTVSRTGQAVSDLVSPALPALGSTVAQTTAAVGKLLSDLTSAISHTVGSVGAPAAPAPDPAAPGTATAPALPAPLIPAGAP